DHAVLGITDVDAKFVDVSGIVLDGAFHGTIGAVKLMRGAEDKAPAVGHVTGEHARLHVRTVIRVSRGRAAHKSESRGPHRNRLQHESYSLEMVNSPVPRSLQGMSKLPIRKVNERPSPERRKICGTQISRGGFATNASGLPSPRNPSL